MTKPVMLKCGHAANATTPDGKPCCAICYGIDDLATTVDESTTDDVLAGRVAVCRYCDNERESSTDLPFFAHRPAHKTDSYYCGCRGWD